MGDSLEKSTMSVYIDEFINSVGGVQEDIYILGKYSLKYQRESVMLYTAYFQTAQKKKRQVNIHIQGMW